MGRIRNDGLMNNKRVYRVRPLNSYTIDELRHSYLWFSRPTEFKGDIQDANIGAFITDTEAIKKGILLVCPGFPFDLWFEKMSHTGICCFTKNRPTQNEIRKFPRCSMGNAICIEFDKEGLVEFFRSHKKCPQDNCFHDVVYDENPTKIEQYDEWSILWETNGNGKLYKTIPGILYEHPRGLDKFIFMLLTRINSKFSAQREMRIILGGRNIPSHEKELKGYRLDIPNSLITKVWIYGNSKKDLIEEVQSIPEIKDKIEFIGNGTEI